MLNKINNLEELLQEKARLKAQLKIVQGELNASALRTRQEFKTLVEERLSLSKQIGQLFQGAGTRQVAENTALSTIGRMAGAGTWWGGLLATLAPMLLDLVRRQLEKRKARRAANQAAAETGAPAAQPKSRRIFKRKSAKPAPDQP